MKIISALKTGAFRTLRAWKSILLVWFVMLLLVTAVVSPIKGALYNAFASSMITEKLANGIQAGVFMDLGKVFSALLSALSSGLITLILISFLVNAFFTGGLFECVRNESAGHSVKEFTQGCARNFWSFAIILVITGFLIFFTVLLVSFVPMIFVDMQGDHVEMVIFRTVIISFTIFMLLLPVLLLVADYARAWKAANSNAGAFRALSKGFSLAFGNFLSSWVLMFVILLVNALFLWLVLEVLPGVIPASGAGMFLFFLLSQVLLIIRLMLRLLRYSSVTCLMEENAVRELSHQI